MIPQVFPKRIPTQPEIFEPPQYEVKCTAVVTKCVFNVIEQFYGKGIFRIKLLLFVFFLSVNLKFHEAINMYLPVVNKIK